MSYIDNSTIEEIKRRLSIVDVVSDYVKLKRSGKNMIGLCPFHVEKSPSFFVNEEKGVYHCFGCGASGNMFTFISNIENTTFPESIKILAKKANVEIKYKEGKFQEQYKEKELIYKVNQRAQFIYTFYLLNRDEGRPALEYLKERGVSKNIIEEFKLGWSPAYGNRLYENLKKENYAERIMLQAGLVMVSNRDNSFFDRFRGRLMFPIIDAMDNIIGFGGRIISDIPNAPKYLNTPETDVFSKRRNLYGINIARDYIREKKCAIIVEGYFDVISLHQAGIKNVVAPLGTALTEEQVLLLRRYAEKIILVFDADTAGSAATIRSISLLLKTDLKINIGRLPNNEDPDSFVRKFGKDKFLEIMNNAPSFIKFIIVTAFKKYNAKTSEGKNNILKFIFAIIVLLNDEILINDILNYLSDKLAVNNEILINEFKKFRRKGKYDNLKFEQNKVNITALQKAERSLAVLLIKYPEIAESVIKELPVDYLTDNLAKYIIKYISDKVQENKKFDVSDFLSFIEDDAIRRFITSELMNEKYDKDVEKQINDYIYKIKDGFIQKKIEKLSAFLKTEKDFEIIRQTEENIQKLFIEKKKILENKNHLIKFKTNE